MSKILSGISCNLDQEMLLAAIPLFQAEMVEVLEWSFDALYNRKSIPDWFVELLETFSKGNSLIGHGVYFSIFTGQWSLEHDQWLKQLEKVSERFNFNHISEHFGFMSGVDFHKGAPLPVPMSNITLSLAQDRLKRISNICRKPVGIENLAFAFNIEEVKRHGDFINQMLIPVNGFMILDLHNIYCQVANFNVEFEELLMYYPLDRVREIHMSGGSWEPSIARDGQLIRRDTHDNGVPDKVFEYLEIALKVCPNLKFVILEQLGVGLKTDNARVQFQQDYIKMKEIVSSYNKSVRSNDNVTNLSFELPKVFSLPSPIQNQTLYKEQMVLSEILENSSNLSIAKEAISNSMLSSSNWNTEQWPDHMLETARSIVQKWKDGFV